MANLSRQALFTPVSGITTAAATGAVNSDILDMQGYDGVVFMARVATANTSNSIKVQSGTATGSLGDLAGTLVAGGSTGGAMVVEVYRPQHRYVRAVLTREAATKAGNIWACRYGGRKNLSQAQTDLVTGEVHVSPSTGTA